MTGESIAFFILSVMAISGAVFMIHFHRVIHMALSLSFTFFSIAGIYLLLQSEFLAVIQILIYAGAITILMLFGIMLTRREDESPSRSYRWYRILVFVGVALFLVVLSGVLYKMPLMTTTVLGNTQSTISHLSQVLFGSYMIPFEAVSILLLVALIGSVMLARKEEG